MWFSNILKQNMYLASRWWWQILCPCKLELKPDTEEDAQAFVDLVESTKPAAGDQLKVSVNENVSTLLDFVFFGFLA